MLEWCIKQYEDGRYSNSEPVAQSLLNLASHFGTRNCNLTAVLLCTRAATLIQLPCAQNSVASQGIDAQRLFSLLFKLISPGKTDTKLAVSLLTYTELKRSLTLLNEIIKKFSYDYPRLEALAEIGENLCSINGKVEIRMQFEELAKNAGWGNRFSDLGISFKDAFLKHAATRHKLFDSIVQHPKCSHSLLTDFCTEFKLSLNDALVCYLKESMHSFLPKPVKSVAADEEWIIPDIPDALVDQMNSIIRKVPDRRLLTQTLVSELQSTMSYNYDIIHFILKNLLVLQSEERDIESCQRSLDVILFLKSYKRKASPGSTEHEEWTIKNPNSTELPLLSLQRLPFHELFEQGPKLTMKIIDKELDVQTIDLWLSTAESLKLSQDQLCFVAVQNTVARTLDKRIGKEHVKWQLSHNYSGLLKDISGVIQKIRHDKLAVACAKNVVHKLPHGIDKLESSYNCFLLAQRWKSRTESTEARDTAARIMDLHQQLLLEHALHKYGVAEPQYLKMLSDPVTLVTSLYDHPSLSSLSVLATDKMPKINECVAEICEKVRCNKVKIQADLLQKWLPPPESGGLGNDEDVTVSNFQLNLLGSQQDSDSSSSLSCSASASLSRVIYLLRGCEQEEVITYLLGCVESETTQINSEHKLRALKCLLAVADPQTLNKHVTVAKVKALLKKLSYVCRLEALGCVTDPDQFNSMDKSALAEGVWRSHRHNPRALFLITDVCLEFGVTKPSLWNAVLGQLAGFASTEEAPLRSLLLCLRQHPHLWVLPGFTHAWNSLVSVAFDRARKPLSDASLEDCIQSAGLLAKCPVTLPCLQSVLQTCSALQLTALSMVIIASTSADDKKLQVCFNL